MFLLFADETNSIPSSSIDKTRRFFVYGGLAIPGDNIVEIHKEIEKIRTEAGYAPENDLKWGSKSIEKTDISIDSFNLCKQKILNLAKKYNCVFFVSLVHEGMAEKKQKFPFGIRTILGLFQSFLDKEKVFGLSFYDPMQGVPKEKDFFKEIFSKGLDYPRGPKLLSKILCHSRTQIGSSHLSSFADIVIGAFRFCVEHPKRPVSREMFLPIFRSILQERHCKLLPLDRGHCRPSYALMTKQLEQTIFKNITP